MPMAKTAMWFALLVLALDFFIFAGPRQQAEWRGKLIYEDGVKVAINPGKPLYGEIKLDLEEEVRIGGEGNEQIQFYRVRDVCADPFGNIYVVDMSNGRVQVFDPSGAYLRTIGRLGQGPGEFEHPTLVRFGGQEGFVHDRNRISRVLSGRLRVADGRPGPHLCPHM